MSRFFRNWNNGLSIAVTNIPKEDAYLKSKKFSDAVAHLCDFRWKIVSISISIENRLDWWIEYLLFEKKDLVTELFQSIMLQSNHLTFMSKWKIFKRLCKLKSGEKSIYDSNIIDKIHKAINLRNKLAHWAFYYDWQDKKFYIEWFENDEIKNRELDDKFLSQSIQSLYDCINNLNSLLSDKSIGTVKYKV